jgi:hypothetical protein
MRGFTVWRVKKFLQALLTNNIEKNWHTSKPWWGGSLFTYLVTEQKHNKKKEFDI